MFHRESIASAGGHDLLRNFLAIAARRSVAA
jgi:anthranilate/para-aminobenzoate synthase component II